MVDKTSRSFQAPRERLGIRITQLANRNIFFWVNIETFFLVQFHTAGKFGFVGNSLLSVGFNGEQTPWMVKFNELAVQFLR